MLMQKLVKMRNSAKKGFTLIELIVVIAILAILMALALPTFNGLKDQAAQGVAAANSRTVYTAATAARALINGDVTSSNLQTKTNEILAGSDIPASEVTVTISGDSITAKWTGTVNGKTYVGTCVDGSATGATGA